MNKIEKIQKARKNALAVVYKQNEKEICTKYYLFGKEVPLHQFKQKIKHLSPIEIIVKNEST